MKRFFAIFALLSLVALVGCDDVKVGLRSDMYVMYYTSTDGNIVVPKADAFDANIISNTYKDGQGKIAFDILILKIKDLRMVHPGLSKDLIVGIFAKSQLLQGLPRQLF